MCKVFCDDTAAWFVFLLDIMAGGVFSIIGGVASSELVDGLGGGDMHLGRAKLRVIE